MLLVPYTNIILYWYRLPQYQVKEIKLCKEQQTDDSPDEKIQPSTIDTKNVNIAWLSV